VWHQKGNWLVCSGPHAGSARLQRQRARDTQSEAKVSSSCDYFLIVCLCFDLAALGRLQIRDRGVYLGTCVTGPEGEPRDDSGVSALDGCEYPGGRGREQETWFGKGWAGVRVRGGWAEENPLLSDRGNQSPEFSVLGRALHPTGWIRFES